MNRKNLFYSLLVCILALASCSKNDEPENPDMPTGDKTVNHPYVLVLGTDNNAYVFPDVESLEGGIYRSAAYSHKSIQMRGDRRIEFIGDKLLYAFAYNQDSPGKSTSFKVENKQLVQRKEYDVANSIQARTSYADKLVGVYSDREYDPDRLPASGTADVAAHFFEFDTSGDRLGRTYAWKSYNFDGTGELGYITTLTPYKGKLLAGIRPIRGYLPPNVFPEPILLFGSDYTERSYMGVFDTEGNLEHLLRDDTRTGMIGGMVKATGRTGIEITDNGNIYAFCSAFSSKVRPSGILRVNPNNWTFDDDFFLDISKISGNRKLFRVYYLGGDLFCLQLFTETGLDMTRYYDAPGAAGKFAILNIATGSIDLLTGEPGHIVSITDPLIDKTTGKAYFGINTKDSQPAIYVVDAPNKTFKKGLVIEGQDVRAVGKLR